MPCKNTRLIEKRILSITNFNALTPPDDRLARSSQPACRKTVTQRVWHATRRVNLASVFSINHVLAPMLNSRA